MQTVPTMSSGKGSAWRSASKYVPRAVACSLVTVSFWGCTSPRQWLQNCFKVGPMYCEPAASVAIDWVDHTKPEILSVSAQDQSWWTVFNDPILNHLIDTAYRQNLDLRAAATRIAESRSRRSIAVGNMFPQTQRALAFYNHAQVSENLGVPIPHTLSFYGDGFNASWEIDFWGRYRRSIEAATANLDASTEAYGDALIMLLSEVASNYVQMRTFEQRLEYARENVVIQQKSADLAQARFDAGTTSELDLRQAKQSLAQTQSTIPPLVSGRRLAANQLCVLLGMPISDLAEELQPAAIPTAPPEVAIGIPADLLRRRPDVRRSERLVAAQNEQIGIAEADFYPQVGVNGFIGYAADDFRKLFDANSFTAFILPSLQWNVLNYGRIINNVRAQEAVMQVTTLEYQQTVLNAGREVEDALVQFIQAQQQTRYLEQSVTEARRAVQIAQDQFEGGITDFNRVYTSQTQLVTQQDQLGTAKGNIALYLVQVYKTIGGGWEYFCQGYGLPGSQSGEVRLEIVPQAPEAE